MKILQRGRINIPELAKFYAKLKDTHSADKLASLFLAGLKFPNMGAIKMELENLVVDMDDLIAHLEKQQRTRWDSPLVSLKQYL